MCRHNDYPIARFLFAKNFQKTHWTQMLVVVVIHFSQRFPGTIIYCANLNTVVSRRIFGGTSLLTTSLSLSRNNKHKWVGRGVGDLSICLSVWVCVRQNKQTSSLITSHIMLKWQLLYRTLGLDVQFNVLLVMRTDRCPQNVEFYLLNFNLLKMSSTTFFTHSLQ